MEALLQQNFFLFTFPGCIAFIRHLTGIFLFMGKGKNDTFSNIVSPLKFMVAVPVPPANT